MPGWTGVAPGEEKRPEKLFEGYHRVKLGRVIELASGDFLAILSNSSGEVAEYIPNDIRPRTKEEREEEKKQTGKGSSEWRFWRLAAAFDYPSAEFWDTPIDERESRHWDAVETLFEIRKQGKEAWIETVPWFNASRNEPSASVEDMKSIVRHDLGDRDPGPGGSKEKQPAPQEPASQGIDPQEVPF